MLFAKIMSLILITVLFQPTVWAQGTVRSKKTNEVQIVRTVPLSENVVRFELCQSNPTENMSCESIGSQNGYYLQDLEERIADLNSNGNWVLGGLITVGVAATAVGAAFGFAVILGGGSSVLATITGAGMKVGAAVAGEFGAIVGGVAANAIVAAGITYTLTAIKKVNPETYWEAAESIETSLMALEDEQSYESIEEFVESLEFALSVLPEASPQLNQNTETNVRPLS